VTTVPVRPWPDDETVREGGSLENSPRGGDGYRALVSAQRLLQDRVAGAVLPADIVARVTAQIEELAELLSAYQGDESQRWDGWRPDLPGRGHPLLPQFVIEEETDSMIRGRVTFTRFYLGGNGAVHGGVTPLLFDDLLGQVVNRHHAEGVARTAYLTVNYRSIGRIDEVLHFDATIDKIAGRKRWGSARLVNGQGELVADAEGLFVKLRPGQP
jgi:acyl-coenzyme A thioesterase PaaI-like protein